MAAPRRFVLPWEDLFLSLLMYIDLAVNVSTDSLEGSAHLFGVIGSKVAFDGDNDRLSSMWTTGLL